MNVKVDHSAPSSTVDIAKYVLSLLIAAGGIVAFYWFGDWPGALRALLPFAGVIAAAAIFLFTSKGRATLEYISEARFELRKVIWPTRQETLRATGVILVVVVLVSLMLWVMDLILGSSIKWLLGS